MDTLKNKSYTSYDYTSRYTSVPNYYDTLEEREVPGIGQNMSKNAEWYAHKVKQGDTLDSLALKYYNNPSYWWAIAYFNDMQDAFINLIDKFDIIKIPKISSIYFEESR